MLLSQHLFQKDYRGPELGGQTKPEPRGAKIPAFKWTAPSRISRKRQTLARLLLNTPLFCEPAIFEHLIVSQLGDGLKQNGHSARRLLCN